MDQNTKDILDTVNFVKDHMLTKEEGVTKEQMRALPRLGRVGRKQGTREFVVPHLPYIIVYRIDIADENELVILGVFHGARDHRDD